MKKILVALVVLALAGGGVFAQGWTFNGIVDAGIGIFIDDDEDDAVLDSISSEGANVSNRTWLNIAHVNEGNTAGMSFRLRADNFYWHTPGFGVNDVDLGLQWAFGWVSFMDSMVRVEGGLVENGLFNSLDRMTAGQDAGEGVGLLTIVQPIPNLHLGFGAFGYGALDADDQAGPQFSFLASYLEPDVFRAVAGFRLAGYGRWSQAYLSLALLGLQDMHLAFTAQFNRIADDFGDYGNIRAFASFAHTGLVENMGLHAGLGFGNRLSDAVDHVSLWIKAGIDYAVSETIVPRFFLHYVMNGAASFDNSFHNNSMRDGFMGLSEDQSFLRLHPAVQFRVAPTTFVELGCIFHVNMGDVGTWRSGGDGMDIAAYALLRVAF